MHISKITLLRETQLHCVSVVERVTGCMGKVCVVNWSFYPLQLIATSTKHVATNLLHLVKVGIESPDKLTDSDLELEDIVQAWKRRVEHVPVLCCVLIFPLHSHSYTVSQCEKSWEWSLETRLQPNLI